MHKLLVTVPILVFMVAPTNAGLRQYQATLSGSDWEVTQASPLQCRMEHEIPRFGLAEFSSKAGSEGHLEMTLASLRQPLKAGLARLIAVPPTYKPGQAPSHLANLRIVAGFDTSLDPQQSWAVLSELEQGNNPTLFYEDGYRRGSYITVMLNSVNFREGYNNFLNCLGQLLPYGFDDVQQTVLNYQSNSDDLDLESVRRLNKVMDYIAYDPAINKIEIGAYSDSYGGRWHNYELSKKRANALKQVLQNAGVKPELLEAQGYGEKRHIASNETPLGRQQNRRVVMKLSRDPSYDEKMALPSQRVKQPQTTQKLPTNSKMVETASTQP